MVGNIGLKKKKQYQTKIKNIEFFSFKKQVTFMKLCWYIMYIDKYFSNVGL